MKYDKILNKINQLSKNDFYSFNPIPHAVIDDFLPDLIANQIYNEWPCSPTLTINTEFNNRIFYRDRNIFGNETKSLIDFLNSEVFLENFKVKFDINEFFGDSDLENAGLHESPKGGFLGMHLDNLVHSKSKRLRIYNLIIYLEKNWPIDNGGNLRIQSLKSKDLVEIEPIFNRAVIFKLSDDSLHGAPDPILGRNNSTRKSLAMFYYGAVVDSPSSSVSDRTLWESNDGLKPYNGNY